MRTLPLIYTPNPQPLLAVDDAQISLVAVQLQPSAVVVFARALVDDPQSDNGYRMWHLDGRRVGGLLTMDDRFPAEIPPHWMPYFAVEDADAAIARAEELGGKAQTDAMDIPPGRFAVLADPHGAHFSIVALHQADPPP